MGLLSFFKTAASVSKKHHASEDVDSKELLHKLKKASDKKKGAEQKAKAPKKDKKG